MRTRRDVYNLPPGDDTLEWYGKAVERMKTLAPADPMGWEFQAAVHGINPLPSSRVGVWAECQHGTSFFLPWHRMYVLHFERIVAKQVLALGGPADWALPYWNYDLSVPATLALPPEFRDPANPLFVSERNPDANAGIQILTSRDVGLRTCLTATQAAFFGGVAPDHTGSLFGAVESIPHNNVHVVVGDVSGGWMIDPDLAALDPIFWLHHANIDRLWQVWLNCNASHKNLPTTYWLDGVPFSFFDSTGAFITMTTRQVLDTREPLLDYQYEDETCPVPFHVGPQPAGPAAASPSVASTPMSANQPELVGATRSAVQLGGQVEHVSLPTPVTPRAFAAAAGVRGVTSLSTPRQLVDHVTLRLENVTSSDVAPTYDVFLNVPDNANPNDHDDRFVGRIAMFGIRQASSPGNTHGGGGQNFALDVTDLYHTLSDSGQIDLANLKVSFVPVSRGGSPKHVTVGRISLYFS
jgi:tyrosinase